MVKNGSCGAFQRYLCKDCDRTLNDKTGTIVAYSKIALRKWLFSIYAFLRLILLDRPKSTKCTFLLARRGTSATARRTRVDCRDVGEERIRVISCPCSSLLIVKPTSST